MTTYAEKQKMCSQFERCSAPLCPLFDMAGQWFACDPICTKHLSNQPGWIKKQRRIQRKKNGNPDIGFFTVEDLDQIKAISNQIRGTNPESGLRVSKQAIDLLKNCQKVKSQKPIRRFSGRTYTTEHMAAFAKGRERFKTEKANSDKNCQKQLFPDGAK